MQVDLSADYLIWDNTTSGTHTSRRNNGNVTTAVAVAKSRALNFKELSASNGAYTAQDRAFIMPTALLASAKPGDYWTDAAARRWTILESPKYANDTRWKLICRDLILANDLRDIIAIERAAVTFGASAGKVRTWGATAYTLAAKVQKLTDELTLQLGVHGFQGDYAVVIESDVVLTGNDHLKWTVNGAARYLEILGQHNPQRIDELPVLDCRAQP